MLKHLSDEFIISSIYSHEETGNDLSFQLDQSVAAWCNDKQVQWHEYQQNGLVRRLNNRDHWAAIWESRMRAPLTPNITSAICAVLPNTFIAPSMLPDLVIGYDKPLRQKGGREEALKVLQTFFKWSCKSLPWRHIKPFNFRTCLLSLVAVFNLGCD